MVWGTQVRYYPNEGRSHISLSSDVGGLPVNFDALPGAVSALPGEISIAPDHLFVAGASLLLVIALHLLLTRTKGGKAMRATSDNPDLARASGIDTDRVLLWTWGIAGALAGAAGVLLVIFNATSQLKPSSGFQLLVPLFAAVVVGGIGNPYGAFLGALLIGVSMEVSTAWALTTYKPAIAFRRHGDCAAVQAARDIGEQGPMIEFLIGFAILVGIYSVFTLGLNVHWGYTGLFNIGVAGFFALGAYTSALLTIPPPQSAQVDDYLFAGDLARRLDSLPVIGPLDLWFVAALIGASLVAAVVALVVGAITIRLRDDYLAIATLGIAESVRLVFLNERWLSNGSKGLYTIPQVFGDIVAPRDYERVYIVVVAVVLGALFLVVRSLAHSPWGRVLRAIREDEVTAAACGKNVFRFKLQAFVLGAVIMAIGGALYTFNLRAISPSVFMPLLGTFIIWAMLVTGGSGRLYGPIAGAFVVWGIWSGSQFLPTPLGSPNVRFFAIGVLVVLVLLYAPNGITPEVARLRERWAVYLRRRTSGSR